MANCNFWVEKLSFKLKNFVHGTKENLSQGSSRRNTGTNWEENAPNHPICANINIESVESTESI